MTDNATCIQSCEAVIEMRCGFGRLQALKSDRLIPCIEQPTLAPQLKEIIQIISSTLKTAPSNYNLMLGRI